MEVIIRKAESNELKVVQDLNHRLFLWDFGRDPTLNTEWPYQEAGETYFAKKISGESGVCFVAEQSGQITGYVIGSIDKTIDKTDTLLRCELENIYIDETARSQGIGKLLVQELTKWCKDKGAQSMFVTAYYHNDDAVSFYKACGFGPFALKLERSL
jgi:ribosomal protein S18 acetylase RimI-like enzyme